VQISNDAFDFVEYYSVVVGVGVLVVSVGGNVEPEVKAVDEFAAYVFSGDGIYVVVGFYEGFVELVFGGGRRRLLLVLIGHGRVIAVEIDDR